MVKILLNNREFNKKPVGSIIGTITKEILKDVVELTPQQLAYEMEKGKTAVLATYPEGVKLSKYSNIEQQSVLMLDFDNKDISNLYTIEDLGKDMFMQENACFYYKTFSNIDSNVDKFRVVFILDNELKDNNSVVNMYKILLDKYPQADQVVFNTNRLFFGGYESVEINFNNVLYTEKYDLSNEYIKKLEEIKVSKQIEIEDLSLDSDKTYILLRRGNFEKVKELVKLKYGDKLSLKFENVYNAGNVLSSMIKIKDFLDLPETNVFKDILHLEKRPSASVFYAETLGIDLYKCFSETKETTLDIINLISKLTGLNNRYNATKLLIELTGSKIVYNDDINKIVDKIRFLSNTLSNMELLKQQYEDIYIISKNYIPLSKLIIDEMLNYTTEDSEGVRVINFLSQESLLSKLIRYDVTLNKSKIRRALDTLVFFGIVNKLKDSEIPEGLLNRLKQKQQDKNNVRRSNVYELVILSDNLLEQLNTKCAILRSEKFTISSNLNGEFLYRVFGKDEALRVFPQFKPDDLCLEDEENVISENTKKLEITAVKYIMKNIEENGYVLEDDIKKYLKRYLKKDYSEFKYKTVRYSIFNDYSLERVKFSKKIKKDLKIQKDLRNKFLYISN